MRAHGLPLFSVDTHRAAADFDVLAFNLSAELVYTNVLEPASTSPACRCATRTARPEHPIVIAGGHCAYNPEPLAEYVDAFVIGDGEEVVGEIAEVDRRVEARRAARRARRVLRELATIPGVYVPSMYDVEYDGAVHPRGARRASPTCPAVVDKRTVADLADWPYPKQQLVPLVEVVHDRLNVEIFRGCTRGCRFCQAGMITRPVRERPEEQVRTMVREGLRRTGYDEVALTSLSSADFSGHRRRRRRPRQRPGRAPAASACRCRSCGSTRSRVGIASEIQKVRRTGLTFAPEARLVAAAPGDQQADHRGRPLRRGRRRVLAGLAAGEALLPHRPADRDGRRHARHRRARDATSSRSAASTRSRRAARCRSAGSCRSRTRRSSGSARTASTSCAARSTLLRDALQGHRAPR